MIRLRRPMSDLINLTGQKFGQWIVLRRAPNRMPRITMWICQCDCGTRKTVAGQMLRAGRSKRCRKCVNLKGSHRPNTVNHLPEYKAWENMKKRCYNAKDDSFKNYGGRGIKVYDEWRFNFQSFFKYVGIRPENLTLDRIDTDGNYEPGNVRWATRREQIANRRKVNISVSV